MPCPVILKDSRIVRRRCFHEADEVVANGVAGGASERASPSEALADGGRLLGPVRTATQSSWGGKPWLGRVTVSGSGQENEVLPPAANTAFYWWPGRAGDATPGQWPVAHRLRWLLATGRVLCVTLENHVVLRQVVTPPRHSGRMAEKRQLKLCCSKSLESGESNLQPAGHMQPRTAMNAAQHKIVNFLKTFVLLIGFH